MKRSQQASDAITEASSELLTIDYETGLQYCLNSEDFYKDMLSEFCIQATKYTKQIDDYFKAQDWKNYAIIAHGLKGASINIGAINFSKLSLEHELAGKEENTEFITNDYDYYKRTLIALIQKIEKMV